MQVRKASYLRDKTYVAVSLNHFFVDVLNSSRTLVIAILAVSLGLTNVQVGLALLLYNIGSALSQPVFGILADRYGSRWFIVGGMAWMIALYSLAAIAGDWLALIAITLAGFGSGAVHPSGTKVASEASDTSRTQATAGFFAAGQTGLFAGPILAGVLLELLGRPGYLMVPLLALIALIYGWRWIVNKPNKKHKPAKKTSISESPAISPEVHVWPWGTIVPLLVIIVCISTVGIAIVNFAPKLFTELGHSPSYVGLTAGLYMLGAAVGGVIGGSMGDRLGRRAPIYVGTIGAILPIFFYIQAEDPWRFLLLLMAGFFAGMPHSVLVLTAQSLLPGRRAFASGLTLGLMFFSGAIGSLLLGYIADQVGLAVALRGIVILLAIAAITTTIMPNRS